jgi:DNA-binding Xre family transcriptional regulator
MRALGIEWQRIIVAKLENGRRSFVTVDELLGLCVALKISPVDLLVPKDAEDMQPYLFTPTRETWAASAREFIRGEAHLYIHKYPEPLDPGFPFASPGTMIDSTQWMPADRAQRVDERYDDSWIEEHERLDEERRRAGDHQDKD